MVVKDCLGRTPFGSLSATLVCSVGVGIFCTCLYTALHITVRGIFEELFFISVPWLETIQVVFVIVAIVMGCYAFLLLIFGFLATGATRQNIYSGAKCIMGGRVSAAFFMTLTYILNFIWVIVSSVSAIPLIIYVMLNAICEEEVRDRDDAYFNTYCFNLSRFGIYINITELVRRDAICDQNELGKFCENVSDAGAMFGLAFGGSLIIVLAMIVFMIIITANYQNIKFSKEITEYRDAVDLELCDSRGLGSTNSKLSLT